jgi:hypothetical protein
MSTETTQPTTTNPDLLRAADLESLATALNDQQARAVDVIVPATKITSVLAAITLDGVEPVVTAEGVTNVNGSYVPNRVGDEGVADKLRIPLAYLRRLRAEAPDLYDANVNGWCSRADAGTSYMLRLLTHADGPHLDGSAGTLRALLSSSFLTIDNIDVLYAILQGMREAGVSDPVIDADLTERRMILRVATPDIAIHAPALLEGYRSPFGGHDVGAGWTPQRVANASRAEGQAIDGGGTTIFAGFVASNSDTGGSAFSITPRLVVKVCNNGLTITADALRKVHVGARQDDGVVVKASTTTVRRTLDLIAAQTADAVQTFLDVDYVRAAVAKLEEAAGVPVEDPSAVLTVVSKKLGFSDAEQATIMRHFIKGGQATAGGVMQAVTSAAQTLPDGDAAWDMEQRGVAAMHEAAAASRALARV